MVVHADANDMLTIGLDCIGFPPERAANHNATTNMTHFTSAFGVEPQIASIIFNEIQVRDIGVNAINKPKVRYFLLGLYWLKRYPIEQISAGVFGYHEDTIRKWVWRYSQAIQALKPYKVSAYYYYC
jgi:hypothetical protein